MNNCKIENFFSTDQWKELIQVDDNLSTSGLSTDEEIYDVAMQNEEKPVEGSDEVEEFFHQWHNTPLLQQIF